MDDWMKSDVAHLHDGILLSLKEGEILPFEAKWVDCENVTLSKKS